MGKYDRPGKLKVAISKIDAKIAKLSKAKAAAGKRAGGS